MLVPLLPLALKGFLPGWSIAWPPGPINSERRPTFPASGPPVRKVGNNYEIDATGLVKDWIKSPGTNHGHARRAR